MSHTPGPWIVEESTTPISKRRSVTTMLMVVAEKGGMPGLIVNQGVVEPRDYANARLIAAAPDLLEACKAWAAASTGEVQQEAFKAALAAIAKAEGK